MLLLFFFSSVYYELLDICEKKKKSVYCNKINMKPSVYYTYTS